MANNTTDFEDVNKLVKKKLKNSDSQRRNIFLHGVTNYDKLNKNNTFAKFNPFLDSTFSKKAKENAEASSIEDKYMDDDMYQMLLMQNGYGINPRSGRRTSYYGLEAKVKRQQLLRMSVHDLIDEVLTKMADEIIVNNENESPITLVIDDAIVDEHITDKKLKKEIIEYAQKSYKKVKKMYGLDQDGSNTSLWYKTYLYLTEGTQAYEIVWDNIDRPKYIVGIHEIDALDLDEFWVDGIRYWRHHKIDMKKDEYVILYDIQVLKIDYSSSSPNNRMSYLEHLIKSFNDLRIMDETKIIWSVTNAMYRTIISIPTQNMSRTSAMASVNREQTRYEDEFIYDGLSGELYINNQARMPFTKNYYMGNGNEGKPEITTIGGEGYDMSGTELNEFYEKRFYRNAKMPYSRFDQNGSSWSVDNRTQLREEIYFSKMVQRQQSNIKMLALKPVRLELVAKYPELKDHEVLDAFNIKFNTYNVFEELMEMDILNEKVDAVTKLNNAFVQLTPDGSEKKFFALKFLLEKYIPEITSEDFARNTELLDLETRALLEYQVSINKLRAEFDPEVRLSEMGIPKTEEILNDDTKIEDIIHNYDERSDEDEEENEVQDDDLELKNEVEDDEEDDNDMDLDKVNNDNISSMRDKLKNVDDKHEKVDEINNKKAEKEDNEKESEEKEDVKETLFERYRKSIK